MINRLDEQKIGKYLDHSPENNDFFKGFLRFISVLGKGTTKNTLNLEFTPFEDIIINSKFEGRQLAAERHMTRISSIYDDPQFVAFVICSSRRSESVYRRVFFDDRTSQIKMDIYRYNSGDDRIVLCDRGVTTANISQIVKCSTFAGVVTKSLAGGRKLINRSVQALSVAKPLLINAVLDKSIEQFDFMKALKEWIISDWGVPKGEDTDCVCDRERIHLKYTAVNTKNGEELTPLGDECAKLFADPRNILNVGLRDRNITTKVYRTRNRDLV